LLIAAVGTTGCQTVANRQAASNPKTSAATQPAVAANTMIPAAPATTPHTAASVAPTVIAEATAADTSAANHYVGDIDQVGFVDRLRAAGLPACGRCAGCFQGAGCQGAQATTPMMMMPPLGRGFDPQEFICNGGDLPPEARALIEDRVGGVNPQDAVVRYTTEAGDVEVLPSNRVCLYSPRFGSVRQITAAVAGEKATGLRGTSQPIGPGGIGLTQPSLMVQDVHELGRADVARRVDAMRDRNRGVPVEGIVQPVLAEDALAILATLDAIALNRLDESQLAILQRGAIAARSWMIRDAVEVMIEDLRVPVLTRDQSVEAFVEYELPEAGRLQISKVADRNHAQQGEQVAFAIYVRNVGDSSVSDVRIIDSLIPRLEYVDGSQRVDRPADFVTSSNNSGSLRLEWTLREPLAVGEAATIEFKALVR
jgi:uncharacterized repeat protein (TIGR01451 family)